MLLPEVTYVRNEVDYFGIERLRKSLQFLRRRAAHQGVPVATKMMLV